MHYGPNSYFRAGRVFPRDGLRLPYFREPPQSRFAGAFIPTPVFRRTGCLAPPARYDEAQLRPAAVAADADSRPRAAESQDVRPPAAETQDARPARTEAADARPARRDECR